MTQQRLAKLTRGRLRTSTLVLVATFVGLLVLYLLFHPPVR